MVTLEQWPLRPDRRQAAVPAPWSLGTATLAVCSFVPRSPSGREVSVDSAGPPGKCHTQTLLSGTCHRGQVNPLLCLTQDGRAEAALHQCRGGSEAPGQAGEMK